ncbi:MAG: hypothetical protein R3D81_17200 [Thalassovita sp.]
MSWRLRNPLNYEYERFSTTALNSIPRKPEVSGYLNRLENALTSGGFDGEFAIVQSKRWRDGGGYRLSAAAHRPVRLRRV